MEGSPAPLDGAAVLADGVVRLFVFGEVGGLAEALAAFGVIASEGSFFGVGTDVHGWWEGLVRMPDCAGDFLRGG